MARLTQVPRRSASSTYDPDSSLTDLNRLLARLQQTVLHADAEREKRLRTSEYERNKAGINLEYARSLLTKLEQDALSVKVHARRQELQADLARKRDVFEQLAERLRELEDLSIDSDNDEGYDTSEGEDLVGGVAVHTPTSGSPDSRPADRGHAPPDEEEEEEEGGRRRGGEDIRGQAESVEEYESTVSSERRGTRFGAAATTTTQTQALTTTTTSRPTGPQSTETTATATTISQNLRPRGPAAAATILAPDKGTTTARNELFGDRSSNNNPAAAATTATTEAILDHHRAEQDALTESLVRMAASLKQSSRAFATSLESERAVLDAAGQGLGRSETGLEAAARRMGALRRATEGRGWWGRMLLYAWIGGLAAAAVLLVFVGPKLRF